MGRGFVFLSETIVFSVVLFLILHATLVQLDGVSSKSTAEIRQRSLERKAIFFADALVKNVSSENSVNGIAVYSTELRRTENGVVDFSKIKKASEFNVAGIRVQKIEAMSKNGEKTVYFEEKTQSENCLNVQRLVRENGLPGKKALLSVTICEE